MTVRAVRFKVSGPLLRQALHMPDTARILHAGPGGWDGEEITVELVVEDVTIPENDVAWETDPTITHTRERFDWDWKLPTPATLTTAQARPEAPPYRPDDDLIGYIEQGQKG